MRNHVACLVLVLSSVSMSAEADRSKGYWCWTHQDGDLGACAPLEAQCSASLSGYNQTSTALGEREVSGSCAWQKNAWQLITKPAPKPPRYFPTKKMCTTGLNKGERCKEVR